MIVLYTDFSLNGPYVGQMKAVIKEKYAKATVLDLMHDVPEFNIRAAAYHLASLTHTFPQDTIFLAVVDPGVGSSDRKACVIKTDTAWFVGPDNGLFNRVVLDAKNYQIWEIERRKGYISETFHGRDIFAPVAADIEQNKLFYGIPYSVKPDKNEWPDSLFEVIYCGHFGNVITRVKEESISTSNIINFNGHQLAFARTFSDVPAGHAFWYINSNHMVEFSVNQGRAEQMLNARVSHKFTLGDLTESLS